MFFPSCKIKAAFPQESILLAKYLKERFGILSTECCRINRLKLTEENQAIVVCHTCASILEESSAAKEVLYAWELINQDDTFPFPDYHGEKITIQDCYMARERIEVQKAVRSLLMKMNFKIVELKANREGADFCGLRTLKPLKDNQMLAPQHYCNSETFTPLDQNKRKVYLEEYASKFETHRVVTYCGACNKALKEGGANTVHLLELLFSM